MKKYLKQIILGLLLVIGIIFVIFLLKNHKEKTFKPITIENTNYVGNKTDKRYLDTIVHVGLKELKLTGIYVIIYSLPQETKDRFESGIDLKAYIRGSGNQYGIWVSDMSRYESINFISHELIHLKQYHDGELVVKDGKTIWKGKEYSLTETQYMDRPWEIDAFDKERDLEKKVSEKLY